MAVAWLLQAYVAVALLLRGMSRGSAAGGLGQRLAAMGRERNMACGLGRGRGGSRPGPQSNLFSLLHPSLSPSTPPVPCPPPTTTQALIMTPLGSSMLNSCAKSYNRCLVDNGISSGNDYRGLCDDVLVGCSALSW